MSEARPGLNEALAGTLSVPEGDFTSATDLNEVEVPNLLNLADGYVSLNRGMLINRFFANSTRTSVPSSWRPRRGARTILGHCPSGRALAKLRLAAIVGRPPRPRIDHA